MWRLWHKLFGWEYIAMSYSGALYVVSRVRETPSGIKYIRRSGTMMFAEDLQGCYVKKLTKTDFCV